MDESIPPEMPDPVERMAAAATRDYDLSVADRLVRRPMPTLDIVNERFVRHLRVGLFQFIHRSADIAIAPVEVQSYADFLGTLAAPTSYNIMSLQPLRGSGLVVCEAGLVSTLVDALYGGACKVQAPMEGRDFSPTEQRVIQRLVGIVAADYNKAWKDIYPIELAHQRTETHVQFVNVATPLEKVVVTTLRIAIGDFAGAVRICIPYGALDPIRDVLYGAQQAQAIAEDRRWVTLLTREIQAAEVTLVAELAQPEVTVGQLLAMKPGDFIQFDRTPQIVASVDGTPVFACHYGTHNARYALRIDESLRGDDPHWLGGSMSIEQSIPSSSGADGAGWAEALEAGSIPAAASAAAANAQAPLQDIHRVLDIPVQLTVELGRKKVPIKHVLQLGQGSIAELDTLAGEPMDVLVNGYLVAQGEVVVVNNKFGIRLTDVVTPSERLRRINRG